MSKLKPKKIKDQKKLDMSLILSARPVVRAPDFIIPYHDHSHVIMISSHLHIFLFCEHYPLRIGEPIIKLSERNGLVGSADGKWSSSQEYKTDNIDPVRFIRSVIRALGVERSQGKFHGKWTEQYGENLILVEK